MRKFIRVSVLVMALAIPAFAGDIPNNVTGNIPNGATATGEIQNGDTGDIPNNITGEIPFGGASSTLIEVLLSLIPLL